MAGTSLLALLDDIATILDDIALMTKVAAKKTAGVLGDDLALNAEQVAGVRADRELPVVWAVARGSFVNKLILVPAALGISAVAPWLVTPLLMAGGLFLCFEGFEKVLHKLQHDGENRSEHSRELQAVADPGVDLVAFEKKKIKGAVRTDFILSAEIIVIALGTVKDAALVQQAAVVSFIAVLMTVGVYALVAGIVKLDDLGLHLVRTSGRSGLAALRLWAGQFILQLAPYLLKGLTIVGTAAMFLVGGGILMHGLPGTQSVVEWAVAQAGRVGALPALLTPLLLNTIAGVVAGALALLAVHAATTVASRFRRA